MTVNVIISLAEGMPSYILSLHNFQKERGTGEEIEGGAEIITVILQRDFPRLADILKEASVTTSHNCDIGLFFSKLFRECHSSTSGRYEATHTLRAAK
jgi:hypothetical protein